MTKTISIWLVAGIMSCGFRNDPIPNTPSPGEPCGHVEFPCGDGACCPNDSVCGGKPFSGCPADSCCFIGGSGGGGADGTFSARPPVPKRWLGIGFGE